LAQAARRTRTESLRTNSTKKKERNQEQGIGRSENKQSKRPNRAEQDKHLIILIDGKPTEHQLTKSEIVRPILIYNLSGRTDSAKFHIGLDSIRFVPVGAERRESKRAEDRIREKEEEARTVPETAWTAGRGGAARYLGEAANPPRLASPSFSLLLFSSTRWIFLCYFYRQPLAVVVEEEAETNPLPMRDTWLLTNRQMGFGET
jgi:hypothetical protein